MVCGVAYGCRTRHLRTGAVAGPPACEGVAHARRGRQRSVGCGKGHALIRRRRTALGVEGHRVAVRSPTGEERVVCGVAYGCRTRHLRSGAVVRSPPAREGVAGAGRCRQCPVERGEGHGLSRRRRTFLGVEVYGVAVGGELRRHIHICRHVGVGTWVLGRIVAPFPEAVPGISCGAHWRTADAGINGLCDSAGDGSICTGCIVESPDWKRSHVRIAEVLDNPPERSEVPGDEGGFFPHLCSGFSYAAAAVRLTACFSIPVGVVHRTGVVKSNQAACICGGGNSASGVANVHSAGIASDESAYI